MDYWPWLMGVVICVCVWLSLDFFSCLATLLVVLSASFDCGKKKLLLDIHTTF